jgi:hypothetical protein
MRSFTVAVHVGTGEGRMTTDSLGLQLDVYRERWPAQAAECADFRPCWTGRASIRSRERLEGHFTGSAWLVSGDGLRVLLTHHRKLGRWLQLGGHADGDRDLARVALREAEEESGLPDLSVEGGPSSTGPPLDSGRGDVPGHWHHDVRYVVRATGSEAFGRRGVARSGMARGGRHRGRSRIGRIAAAHGATLAGAFEEIRRRAADGSPPIA